MIPNLTPERLRDMIMAGAEAVNRYKQDINNLNVFPVPDGDTGTNMSLTLASVVEQLKRERPKTFPHLGSVISSASLAGARGNSGVILSQIFRGFGKFLRGLKGQTMGPGEFIDMVDTGRAVAYSSVVKPVEGTILTLIRMLAEDFKSKKGAYVDIVTLMEDMVKRAWEIVRITPTMLDVLAEAGVVDAGAFGLAIFFEGMRAYLKGEEPVVGIEYQPASASAVAEFEFGESQYPFCTEASVILEDNKFNLADFLTEVGDSIVIGKDGDVVHFHVHTDRPLEVLSEIARHGTLVKVKIDNMDAQMKGILKESKKKELAMVAVATGDGWKELFRSMGVDVIVEGGQTMNPSVRQLADAVKHAPADNVIILPNNKNIVMTAHQVSDVVNKNVYVIPTHSMPEAIALLMHVDPGMKPDEIMALYRQLRNEIMVGEITQAVRSSKIGGAEIKEGMKLVLIDGDLKWAGFASDEEALAKLLEIMSQEDVGIVTVFKGAGKEDVELEQLLSEVLGEDIEFEIHYGGQPLYPYLVLGEL